MKVRVLRNLKVLIPLAFMLGVMVTLVSYSVTFYRLFCAATGFGGTTQRADQDTANVSRQTVIVRFNTDVDGKLPWAFRPLQPEVRVHLGESTLVYFSAKNLSDQPIVGHAAFNVTPAKAGTYFVKIQCFCFNEERLAGGESVQMPVDFYVDPQLASDPTTLDVGTITLSYTFFRSTDPAGAKDLSRFATVARTAASPDATRGKALFRTRCAACHDLSTNKIGPPLSGVVGRNAGTADGYSYSPALKASGVRWTPTNLDRWLAAPRQFVVGTRMPIAVPDSLERRDIIAFLANSGKPNSHASP